MLSESDICVAILNWNGLHHLQQFLPSVVRNSGNARIRVIDNASADESVLWLKSTFPQVEIDVLDKNYGFTGGYNRGIDRLDSELVVLLNSDVEVRTHWLQPLLKRMNSDKKVAACQPKILSLREPDVFEFAGACGGFLDVFGYPFCRGRIFDHCEKDRSQYEEAIPVFWASGACMMVRRRDFLEAGGLEESFFAHMEEIDLCWRFLHLGKEIWAEPSSQVLHLGAGTLAKSNPRKTYLNFRNSLAMLYSNSVDGNAFLLIFIRLLLDGIAGVRFLLTGQAAHCMAIVRAHFSFYGQLPYWQKRRQSHAKKKRYAVHSGLLYRGSIVWHHFILKKKSYSELEF